MRRIVFRLYSQREKYDEITIYPIELEQDRDEAYMALLVRTRVGSKLSIEPFNSNKKQHAYKFEIDETTRLDLNQVQFWSLGRWEILTQFKDGSFQVDSLSSRPIQELPGTQPSQPGSTIKASPWPGPAYLKTLNTGEAIANQEDVVKAWQQEIEDRSKHLGKALLERKAGIHSLLDRIEQHTQYLHTPQCSIRYTGDHSLPCSCNDLQDSK